MKKIFSLFGTISLDGMEDINKQLKDFDNKMVKMSKQLTKYGRQMTAVGKTMTKTITAPLAGVAAAAVKFGGDFQKSMTQSLAIMGNVSDEMRKKMSDTAREVARTSTISANEAAKSYYYLASAGKDAEQSIALLPKVAKFAEAGQFDMALATDLLTDAQSALGMTSKDAAEDLENMTRVSDVLVKANTLANASVQQFSEALTNKAGAAMRSVGMSVEEGVAVLAAFADQGTKGSEAGTQFAIVMRDLQTKALENKDAFEQMNVSVFDNNGEMNNMSDIIGDIERLMTGMTDAQKKATLSTLGFTDKSIAALQTLVGTSDKIKEYETNLKSAAGITDEVANKQMQNFNDQMTMIKNRLIDAAISISEELLPVIQNELMPIVDKLVEKITSMVKWFRNLGDSQKNLMIKLSAFLAVLGPGLIVIGKAVIVIGNLRKAMILMNTVFLTNPIGQFILAVTALATAGWAVVHAWKNMNKAMDENRKKIKEDIELKQNQQKINALETLIDLYGRLANMDKEVISSEEYRNVSREITNLEKIVGGFGIEFTGAFGTRMEAAKQKLAEFRGELSKTGDEVEDTIEEIMIQGDSAESIEEEQLQAKLDRLQEEYDAEKELLEQQIEKGEKEIAIANEVEEQLKKMDEERKAEEDRIWQEYLDKKQKDKEEELRIEEEHQEQVKKLRVDAVNATFDIFSSFNQNEEIALDNKYKKDKERIENSTMDEEKKAKALENLDKTYQKKKDEMRRKQAIMDKAQALFNIALNTAESITKVLWNPIMVGVVAALGAAQAAAVALKPIPLQKGGLIQGSPGGVFSMVGENNKDELVLPLEEGVSKLANMLIEKLGSMAFPNNSSPAAALASGGMGGGKNLTLNIGNFYGDESGIKELTRRIIPLLNSENERKGIS